MKMENVAFTRLNYKSIMKKILFYIICLIAIVSCNSKRTLVDDLNKSIVDDSIRTINDTNAFCKQGRNLVYLLDPSCSVCISNYVMFLESLKFAKCNYDSLFTIVLNGNYLMNVEYYLGRDNIYRPGTERYIIDKDGKLTEYYNILSGNNGILLFDSGILMFCTTVYAYKFEKGRGLVSVNER